MNATQAMKLKLFLTELSFHSAKSFELSGRLPVYSLVHLSENGTVLVKQVREDQLSSLSPRQIAQHLLVRAASYKVYYGPHGHYVHSSKRCELNLLDSTEPLPLRHGLTIVPQTKKPSDLLCIHRPTGKWFISSHQFYHLWQVVVKGRLNGRDGLEGDALKRKLMSGNTLCTNTYRKWSLAVKANGGLKEDGTPVTMQDREDRLYAQRTEKHSIENVHLYAMIALLVLYNEDPTESNYPRNLSGLAVDAWDIPCTSGDIRYTWGMGEARTGLPSLQWLNTLRRRAEPETRPTGRALKVHQSYKVCVSEFPPLPQKAKSREARDEPRLEDSRLARSYQLYPPTSQVQTTGYGYEYTV